MYGLFLTYFTFGSMVWQFWYALNGDPNFRPEDKKAEMRKVYENRYIIAAFTLNFIVLVLLTGFIKFHIKLAVQNKTTIENLEEDGKPYKSKWDIGQSGNVKQILGANSWLYMFPAFWATRKPIGDGIYWQTM